MTTPVMPAPVMLPALSPIDALPRVRAATYELVVGLESGAPGAPALLFVPGAYHGAWCYGPYLAYFAARGVACYAIDLPGHGALFAPEGNLALGVADLGQSVRAACAALDRPLVLVGHSMGALPTLLAASQSQVVGVVLLAPSPPGNLPGAQGLPLVPVQALVPPPGAQEIRTRFLGVEGPCDVAAIAARLTAESPQVLNDRYALRVSIHPDDVRVPGLCVEAGRDDAARHPAGQDAAIADFLGFDYQLLPEQPHCLMYGPLWEDSAAVLAGWLAQTFGQAHAEGAHGAAPAVARSA